MATASPAEPGARPARAFGALPGTGAGGHGGAGLDGWLASLAALFAVPDGYRVEDVERVVALDMLRCGDEVLDRLVGAGLRCSGPPGAERFDRYDLFNLALHSGSGGSVPERALEFALRWMGGPAESWYRPMRWDFSVELSCTRPGGCGDAPRWWLARPEPEVNGGAVESLATTPAGARGEGADLAAGGPQGLAVRARVSTVGRPEQLRSPRLREIVAPFFGGAYRWARMPEELQWCPEVVLPHGVAPCMSACLHLAAQCRAEGFEARTRRGWILGMLDLAHAWLEVRDSDGRVKVVDPIFAMLSRYARDPNPAFPAACVGSRMNRLLPTGHEADSYLSRHSCDGAARTPRKKTDVRLVRDTERPAT